MLSPAPHLHLTGLQGGVDRLNSLPAAEVDAALQALLQPFSTAGAVPHTLPDLATLPLAAQANLLLLLRAAPHRFCSTQQAALLQGMKQLAVSGGCGAGLLQLLVAHVGAEPPPIPPCPEFLYSAQPCFPWAPVLTDANAAATLQQQLSAAAAAAAPEVQQQQQGQQDMLGAAGTKRQADGEPEPDSPAKRPRARVRAAVAAVAPGAGGAPSELEAAAATVRQTLGSHRAGGAGTLTAVTPELRSALGALLTHASSSGGGAAGSPAAAAAAATLRSAGLHSLAEDDALLLLLLGEVVTPSSSFARCSAAAAWLLLPRLRWLEGAAPRALAASAEHIASCNPQAFIAACLQPLLSGSGLNKHQAELLGSLLKAALPAQLLPDVLAAACSAPVDGTAGTAAAAVGGAAPAAAAQQAGAAWSEHTVGVLQSVLNCKPALSAAAVAQLVGAFQAAAGGSAELAASPKFAKLALSLVKQYPTEAAGAKAQLQAVALACKSFMAKTLAAAVGKL